MLAANVMLHVQQVVSGAVFDNHAGVVVIAGQEYGTGSSRDWAAKGTNLLGVKVVVAQSYERIHRSNLVGMGVLPLQFKEGTSAQTLKLDGSENYDVVGLGVALKPQQDLALRITRRDGAVCLVVADAEYEGRQEVDVALCLLGVLAKKVAHVDEADQPSVLNDGDVPDSVLTHRSKHGVDVVFRRARHDVPIHVRADGSLGRGVKFLPERAADVDNRDYTQQRTVRAADTGESLVRSTDRIGSPAECVRFLDHDGPGRKARARSGRHDLADVAPRPQGHPRRGAHRDRL